MVDFVYIFQIPIAKKKKLKKKINNNNNNNNNRENMVSTPL